MTVVLHLIEASNDDHPVRGDQVRRLRHPFADAMAADGLASVLGALDGLDPAEPMVVVHPDVDLVPVERLAALLRRSQRRRAMIMIGHGLGPLGAELLVERLVVRLTDPGVGLDEAATWCRQTEATITDVVWTMRADARWARLDLRQRLRARLPDRRVRSQLGLERHDVVASTGQLLAGLEVSEADVLVGGRDAHVIVQALEQLGASRAGSVRVVGTTTESSVVAELVICSAIRPTSEDRDPGRGATTAPPGSGSPLRVPRRRG